MSGPPVRRLVLVRAGILRALSPDVQGRAFVSPAPSDPLADQDRRYVFTNSLLNFGEGLRFGAYRRLQSHEKSLDNAPDSHDRPPPAQPLELAAAGAPFRRSRCADRCRPAASRESG